MPKQCVEPPTGADISALTGGSSRDRSSHAFSNPLNPGGQNYFAHRRSMTHDRSLVNDFLHPEFSGGGFPAAAASQSLQS